MQNIINESVLEKYCMEYFRSIGYQTALGPDMLPGADNPLRTDERQPFLPGNIRSALRRLNPTLPESVLEDAYERLISLQEPSLIARNETLHHYLTNGVSIPHRTSDGQDTASLVQIIDFNQPDNNEFLAVNQFSIKGPVNRRRPDIVVFINGLPLAVLELKNPANERTDIEAAYNQIQTYKTDIPALFDYNLACVYCRMGLWRGWAHLRRI